MAAGIIQGTVTTTSGETIEMSWLVYDTVTPTKWYNVSHLVNSAGAGAAFGSGANGATVLRVALATDSPGVTGLGQTTMAASLPVAMANDQSWPVGIVGFAKAEDIASASGDLGIPAMALRQAAIGPTSGTDLDYEMLQLDAFGLLKTGPDSFAVSGSVTSAAVLFTQDMTGYESITVQVTSAGTTCTITYETSDDNTNWVSSSGMSSAQLGITAPVATSTTALLLQFPKRGRYFRARVSTYGSGTVTVVGNLSKSPVSISSFVNVSGTGAFTVGSTGSAHDSAIAGVPWRGAGRALTANYTAVATGDTADWVSTLVGAQIHKPYSIPEGDWSYAAATAGISNTTTAVTIAAAAGAGLRNYITSIQLMSEALGAATEFAIRDGAAGTVIWRTKIATGGVTAGESISLPSPLKSTANTLLEIVTLTASVTGAVYFNAQGYIAP